MKIFTIGTFDERGQPTGWGFAGEPEKPYEAAIDIHTDGSITWGTIPYSELAEIAETGVIPEKYLYKPEPTPQTQRSRNVINWLYLWNMAKAWFLRP